MSYRASGIRLKGAFVEKLGERLYGVSCWERVSFELTTVERVRCTGFLYRKHERQEEIVFLSEKIFYAIQMDLNII